jgi:hypothetical protein
MKLALYFSLLFLLTACVNTPNPSEVSPDFKVGEAGVMVLCEGMRGTDNASITRYDFTTGSYSANYFASQNAGLKLGDNANDLVLLDTLCLVSVSGAGTIEIFSLNTGKSIRRLIFPQHTMVRKMYPVNDTLCFVTSYVEWSENEFYVYYFNPQIENNQETLISNRIQVGSYPEGIAYNNGRLFVANSGYGDFYQTDAKASTISIIDIISKQEVQCIKTGINPNRLHCKNGKLYVACWGLPSDTNSIGGIFEYDVNSMELLRQWNTSVYDLCFNDNGDTLFYLNSTMKDVSVGNNSAGIGIIPLTKSNAKPISFIKNNKQYEIWTALAVHSTRNEMYIANSFKYTTAGEILIYDISSPDIVKQRLTTGVIPNTIRFY